MSEMFFLRSDPIYSNARTEFRRGKSTSYINCSQIQKRIKLKVHTLKDIIEPLQNKKQFLQEEFGVLRLGIFGSFAQGTQTISSDIDIVIEMDSSKKNLRNYLAVKRLLDDEFEKSVDLGFEHTLKPVVREKIKGKITYV